MHTIRKAATLGVIAALSLSMAACGSSKKSAASGSGSAACPGGKVRMGIEPYEDAAKLTPAYKVVADALSKSLGCPVELSIVESYSAEVLAMKSGKLDVAEFGPLGFVFATQDADAEALASFANADGTLSTYTAGIYVPVASPIKAITDLKGKTLALSSTGSTSGDALPRYAIEKAGLKDTDVKLDYAGGHPQSLLALTSGKVDAGEINSQTLTTAIAAKQIDISKYRQIWKSDAIPNDPVTVYGKLPQAFKDKVKAALLSLTPAELTQVGTYLDVEPAGPMKAVTKADYQALFDLADTLHLTSKDA